MVRVACLMRACTRAVALSPQALHGGAYLSLFSPFGVAREKLEGASI